MQFLGLGLRLGLPLQLHAGFPLPLLNADCHPAIRVVCSSSNWRWSEFQVESKCSSKSFHCRVKTEEEDGRSSSQQALMHPDQTPHSCTLFLHYFSKPKHRKCSTYQIDIVFLIFRRMCFKVKNPSISPKKKKEKKKGDNLSIKLILSYSSIWLRHYILHQCNHGPPNITTELSSATMMTLALNNPITIL